MRIGTMMLVGSCIAMSGCLDQGQSATAENQSALHDDSALGRSKVRRVLLLSLDGFHDFDLSRYVASHPSSALARLSASGLTYKNAYTSAISDSFPGTLAMVTGGSPAVTGVYYDVSFDRSLSPAGSACATRGAVVPYNEQINVDVNNGALGINTAKLPLDPSRGCTPVFPHQYLRINTIYEVIKAAGMRTAAIDKHPSYEILNGPSGAGLDDLYTPEINPAKKDIAKTIANDELKVTAILNQINGFASTDNARATPVGVPAIFGMNFQAPNIGQKFSGYADAAGTPAAGVGGKPGLAEAFDYVDGAIDRMLSELDSRGLTSSTLIIVGAKHGNSPVDRTLAHLINPATALVPLINSVAPGLAAQVTDDTNALIWLTDPSRAADVAAVLRANAASIGADTISVQGEIDSLFDGQLAGNPSRRPDIIVEPTLGVVYAAPGSKLCDHGGWHEQDRHVALLISGPKVGSGETINRQVSVAQIAPTIVKALGLKLRALDAVRLEHIQRLPLHEDDDCNDEAQD